MSDPLGSWTLDFLNLPLYQIFSQLELPCFEAWPTISQLNHAATRWSPQLSNAKGQVIQFVPQDTKKNKAFAEQYEPRIYLTGEVQTRHKNWHDFFNACCWSLYPKSKALLNALQYQDMLQYGVGNRSQQQHVLTQFDECGIVIVCQQQSLIDLLLQHRWQDLFYDCRADVLEHMQCYIFGHAIFEKALNPYIGLTAKAIVLNHPKMTLTAIDHAITDYFDQQKWQALKKPLQAFPLLGYPCWFEPQTLDFYQNKTYFRPL